MLNISIAKKMDKWTKEDLSHETFYEFMKASGLVTNSSSQYEFWMRSWKFYKQLSKAR